MIKTRLLKKKFFLVLLKKNIKVIFLHLRFFTGHVPRSLTGFVPSYPIDTRTSALTAVPKFEIKIIGVLCNFDHVLGY